MNKAYQQNHNEHFRVLCGLRNPTEVAPEDSLHNVGAHVLDELALQQESFTGWRNTEAGNIGTLKLDDIQVELFEPLHININHSGVPLKSLLDELEVPSTEVVVVFDDIDLQPGQVKVRRGSSRDSHKGVQSIVDELQANDFVRIRCGVGRPPKESGISILEWVKGNMNPELLEPIKEMKKRVAAGIKTLLSKGIQAAQNELNS